VIAKDGSNGGPAKRPRCDFPQHADGNADGDISNKNGYGGALQLLDNYWMALPRSNGYGHAATSNFHSARE